MKGNKAHMAAANPSHPRPCTTDHGSPIAGHSRRAGFTLVELLVVVGIIGLLLVLIAPAFKYIKGGTDVTSAGYTIKGPLDRARTYAMANNTFTWVGGAGDVRSEEHTSELQSHVNLVCRLLLEKKKTN